MAAPLLARLRRHLLVVERACSTLFCACRQKQLHTAGRGKPPVPMAFCAAFAVGRLPRSTPTQRYLAVTCTNLPAWRFFLPTCLPLRYLVSVTLPVYRLTFDSPCTFMPYSVTCTGFLQYYTPRWRRRDYLPAALHRRIPVPHTPAQRAAEQRNRPPCLPATRYMRVSPPPVQ